MKINIKYGYFTEPFLDHPDDDLEYDEFLELIGLKDISYSEIYATFEVVNEQKWMLAKIKYGI